MGNNHLQLCTIAIQITYKGAVYLTCEGTSKRLQNAIYIQSIWADTDLSFRGSPWWSL